MNNVCLQFVRLLVLVGYIAGQIGFPIPETQEAPDGLAYPCQGHQCGCSSADQCWQGCCCMSLRERLAWAERHHVLPPITLADSSPESTDDCRSDLACCASGEKSEKSQGEKDSKPPRRWVLSIQAMKCRGHSANWIASAEPALIAHAFATRHCDGPPVGNLSWMNESARNSSSPPIVPPG